MTADVRDERWQRLAELAVHAANVQPGQSVIVSAEYNQAEAARASAAAAYDRGAKFVDVVYFDLRVKHARALHANPETLEFVPRWWADRLLALADELGARIMFAGLNTPNLFRDIDPPVSGRDARPWIKEWSTVIGDRSTNWTLVMTCSSSRQRRSSAASRCGSSGATGSSTSRTCRRRRSSRARIPNGQRVT